MRTRLLRIVPITITLCTCFGSGYAQPASAISPSSGRPAPQRQYGLFILNSSIIVNGSLAQLKKEAIRGVVIYKGNDAPEGLRNLSSPGIMVLTYDMQVPSQSFTEISAQRGLGGPLKFVLNGHPLTATQVATLRITPESIGVVSVTPPTDAVRETTVSIQVAESKPDYSKYPSGTVFLR